MSTDDGEGRWRDVAELAALFKVSPKRVYRGVKHEHWPHHRTGPFERSPIRFSPQDAVEIGDLLRPASVAAARTVRRPAVSAIQRGMQRRAA